ncbi:histidine phosphatase family protein [Ferrimonas sp. SCSIO 43195]|uniref:histidine phosphatase family protein n=1 Tax=Ferrimonas sp. SCSIO 43195 TaxID=2822844 RepID=UPI0020765B9A|nr:histidine phosphatase family protein [Ferrimonas sp. SCSIO 43195]USD39475.1 histidine phosphatase family protein [Ferrimonas sp. SCSIO 43195]
MKGLVGSMLLLLVTFLSPLAAAEPVLTAAPIDTSPPLMVVLVRHAEKQKSGSDPALTQQGEARAQALAKLLQSAQLDVVHSTDFARTRATAAPTAAALNVPVSLYDPRQLEAFANQLKRRGGRHLVVGHSNTTPALVGLLGGEAGDGIDDASEFDRLYILTRNADGQTSTVRLHYGL